MDPATLFSIDVSAHDCTFLFMFVPVFLNVHITGVRAEKFFRRSKAQARQDPGASRSVSHSVSCSAPWSISRAVSHCLSVCLPRSSHILPLGVLTRACRMRVITSI